MPAKLVVRNLTKSYGDVQAVRGVDLEVADGEIFGLLGPNGAGKTSTLECVVGLRQPDSGAVEVCGIDALAHPSRVKQRVGVALQSTSLQEKITPREAIKLFRAFYEKQADVSSLIRRFSLTEKANAPFDTLSGGQRQRLALALAFVNDPELLFLDEPTTGLDPHSRRDLHADILQMKTDGRTVILSTHYIEEAEALCDRVAIVDQGKVIAVGKPADLIAASRASTRVVISAAAPIDPAALSARACVTSADTSNGSTVIKTTSAGKTIADVLKLLEETHNELLDLQILRPSLEDVFIELTGTSLRK